METIFIAEDDKKLAETLSRYLSLNGYEVYTRNDGKRALEFIRQQQSKINLIILDIKMPVLSGLDLCRIVRDENIQIPMLMLTSIGDNATIVRALDKGADDYLTKPFSMPELIARIRALLRRPQYFENKKYQAKGIVIDPENRSLFYKGTQVILGRREFDLLLFLMKNKNQLLTREQILLSVWNISSVPFPNTIDVHIRKIRNQLEKVSPEAKNIIQSVYGIGYRIND